MTDDNLNPSHVPELNFMVLRTVVTGGVEFAKKWMQDTEDAYIHSKNDLQCKMSMALTCGKMLAEEIDRLRAENQRMEQNAIAVLGQPYEDPVGKLCLAVLGMVTEMKRMERGDFTPEEFQRLCHHRDEKPDCTAQDFFNGCTEYQQKLFGKNAISQEATRCHAIQAVVDEAQKIRARERERIAAAVEEWDDIPPEDARATAAFIRGGCK